MSHLTHKRNGRQQARIDQHQTQRNSAEGQTEHLRQHPTGKTLRRNQSRQRQTQQRRNHADEHQRTEDHCSSFVGVPIIFSEEYSEPRS